MDPWDRSDLIRRVQLALDVAGSALDAAIDDDLATGRDGPRPLEPVPTASEAQPLRLAKVVTEAAMLARCAAGADDELTQGVLSLARRLIPFAQGESVRAALCREPASAFVHATGHVQLRDLGHEDRAIDALLAEIVGGADVGGPERLPAQELETDWLRRTWSNDWADGTVDADALRRSCAGRRLDALTSSTQDLYAFTHVVLYATDMGRRSVVMPCPVADIAADAEAGLAAAIDADNLDLAAELLWTWPMLRLPLSPAAAFAFRVLASAQDAAGFVPGPGFAPGMFESLEGATRDRYVLRTSYHATFVAGFLCAAMLRNGDRLSPASSAEPGDDREARIDLVASLLPARSRVARWEAAFIGLDERSRDSLGPFLLAIALRRASAANDIGLTRRCLEVAVRCGLTDGPAVRQALALLRRATLVARLGDPPAAGPGARRSAASPAEAHASGRRTV